MAYTTDQLYRIAEAAAPFAELLQAHHVDKADDLPIYQVNNVKITFGQLRALNAALGLSLPERIEVKPSRPQNPRLGGDDIRPVTAAGARKLIGKHVQYVRHYDIDRRSETYTTRAGIIADARGRNIEISGDWITLSSLAEMRLLPLTTTEEPS